MLLPLVFMGPGRMSLDALVRRRNISNHSKRLVFRAPERLTHNPKEMI
jgi:hypothetical protein